TTVEVVAEGGPATNITVPPENATGVSTESVFVSAFVDLIVHVVVPVASVAGQLESVLFEPLAENVTACACDALPAASLKTIVTVEVSTPLAVTGLVPVIDEFAATGPPVAGWPTANTPKLVVVPEVLDVPVETLDRGFQPAEGQVPPGRRTCGMNCVL